MPLDTYTFQVPEEQLKPTTEQPIGQAKRPNFEVEFQKKLNEQDFYVSPDQSPDAQWNLEADDFNPQSPMLNSNTYDSPTERNSHVNNMAEVRTAEQSEVPDYHESFKKYNTLQLAQLIIQTGEYAVNNVRLPEVGKEI